MRGRLHPKLGIGMDRAIGMKSPDGAICTLSLSFNNEGPFGAFFRYICDNGAYVANYDDLFTGEGEQIDLSDLAVSTDGIELADREVAGRRNLRGGGLRADERRVVLGVR